jgi:hypothetical protein
MNNEVIVNIDVKPCVSNTEPCRLTLKGRSENIVNIPTNYKGLGLLDKTELSPGIFLAPSLTRGENGVCYQYCKLNRKGPDGRFTPGSLRGSGRGGRFTDLRSLSCSR